MEKKNHVPVRHMRFYGKQVQHVGLQLYLIVKIIFKRVTNFPKKQSDIDFYYYTVFFINCDYAICNLVSLHC